MRLSPLKRLLLAALLWLPAMFFVWVYWSSVFALPATRTAQAVLVGHYDSLFAEVYRGFPRDLIDPAMLPVQPGTPTEGSHARDDHLLLLRFNPQAMPPAMQAQRQATGEEPLPLVNSMIYGYGLALVWGLVMATPLSARRRWLQLTARGEAVTLDDILADIRRRDARDAGRGAAPMAQAVDAVLPDTTDLDIEAAFDAARRIVEAARARMTG